MQTFLMFQQHLANLVQATIILLTMRVTFEIRNTLPVFVHTVVCVCTVVCVFRCTVVCVQLYVYTVVCVHLYVYTVVCVLCCEKL